VGKGGGGEVYAMAPKTHFVAGTERLNMFQGAKRCYNDTKGSLYLLCTVRLESPPFQRIVIRPTKLQNVIFLRSCVSV
jgi:hypothetical protein